jgi:hypothetical protein
MRNLISVTLLVLVLSVFAAARPLKQARVIRGGPAHVLRASKPSNT